MKNTILQLLAICILTTIIYIPSLKAPFNLDDKDLLLSNPVVRNPSNATEFSRKIGTLLTFHVNYKFWGSKPFTYHVGNLMFHLVNVCLVYLLTSLLTKQQLTSWLVALIFAIHPIQTSAVSYIWQRSEIISASVYLVCLISYLKKWWWLVILSFLAGLCEKGTIITIPVMILMYEIIFNNRRWAKWTMGCLVILTVVMFSLPQIHPIMWKLTAGDFSYHYFITQFYVWIQYLWMVFNPSLMSVEHDVRIARSIMDVAPYFAGVVAILTTAWLLRKDKLVSFGIFWFFIYLLATSFVMREPMWDHRAYLAIYGIILAVVLIIRRLNIPSVLFAVAILLCFSTYQRNVLWSSPVALLEDAVKKSPNKARAHHILGVRYFLNKRYEDAKKQWEITIKLEPRFADSWNNLGVMSAMQDKLPEAEQYFMRASFYRNGWALPLINLGDLSIAKKDFKMAETYYKLAVEGEPLNSIALSRLGDITKMRGDKQQAEYFYQRAIKSDPRRSTQH